MNMMLRTSSKFHNRSSRNGTMMDVHVRGLAVRIHTHLELEAGLGEVKIHRSTDSTVSPS